MTDRWTLVDLSYFYNLLQLHQLSRALRSSTQQLVQVPYMSTDLVDAPSATTQLQPGIPFVLPLKIARPYMVSSAT